MDFAKCKLCKEFITIYPWDTDLLYLGMTLVHNYTNYFAVTLSLKDNKIKVKIKMF